MRLLVISGAFPPMVAAEANHALHLCQHLAKRGLEVHLLTTKGSERTNGFPFEVHPIMRNWSWSELPTFAKFVKRCSPQAALLIYIGFTYNDHPMITFAPTVSKKVLPRLAFVTQFEGVMGAPTDRWPTFTRLLRKGVKLWAGSHHVDYEFGTLLRDSDRVIVLAGHHQAKLANLYSPVNQKSVLIPPPPLITMSEDHDGAARQQGRQILNAASDDFVITYFGYIYPNKGVETLLRAFHIVSGRNSNIRLVIAGGMAAHLYDTRLSYVKQLRELPKALGIQDKVTWTGQCDWDTDHASLYFRASDVCVLPFDHGVAMNNSSFAAAAAHGLPIISTQGPTLEQFFIHEENVFLCPPQDPQALAAAIQTLMDKPDLRRRLGAGALKFSQEWFSWDRAIDRTISTFVPQ